MHIFFFPDIVAPSPVGSTGTATGGRVQETSATTPQTLQAQTPTISAGKMDRVHVNLDLEISENHAGDLFVHTV